MQPADLRPSDITARLGAPWIPAADVVSFVKETMNADIKIHHMPELASWTVEARQLGYLAVGTSEWGTDRRHAGELLADALNSRVPQIFDTIRDGQAEKRVLNVVDTEAAKEKLHKIKESFGRWVWSNPDRTDRLARVYNDRFNNIAPRKFDGSHLQLPGASGAFVLYGHQKRGIWRIISDGATYLAHAVGAGKTMTFAAARHCSRRTPRSSRAGSRRMSLSPRIRTKVTSIGSIPSMRPVTTSSRSPSARPPNRPLFLLFPNAMPPPGHTGGGFVSSNRKVCTMSASLIFDIVPIGSIVSWSDEHRGRQTVTE